MNPESASTWPLWAVDQPLESPARHGGDFLMQVLFCSSAPPHITWSGSG